MLKFKISTRGDFRNTKRFLKNAVSSEGIPEIVKDCAEEGLKLLSSATPKDSGVTANSWSYSISKGKRGYSIEWSNNSTTSTGIPIVVLLQYGHGTGNGGYVKGNDFVTPSIEEVMKELSNSIETEVSRY